METPKVQAVEETPMPVGFWTDLVAAVRQELRPPVSGFFASSPNAPVQGRLQGNKLALLCDSDFIVQMLNKPELLQMVGRKAAMILGRNVEVTVVDRSADPGADEKMDKLLAFCKAHSDVIKIKE